MFIRFPLLAFSFKKKKYLYLGLEILASTNSLICFFSWLEMPAETYSSLEVMHYDQSANAPQRDHAKCPPELDTAVLAPQVR